MLALMGPDAEPEPTPLPLLCLPRFLLLFLRVSRGCFHTLSLVLDAPPPVPALRGPLRVDVVVVVAKVIVVASVVVLALEMADLYGRGRETSFSRSAARNPSTPSR